MNNENIRVIARLSVLLIFILGLLACDVNLPGDVKPSVKDLQNKDLPKTVEALANQEGSRALATMEALTNKEGGQAIATLQAFATAQGQQAFATGQAFAADKGGDLLATAAAYAADKDISATVEAAIVSAKDYVSGESPQDIPVVDVNTISALYKSKAMVTYTTSLEYDTVVNFYKGRMKAEGWSKVEKETTETALAAVLVFGKNGRKASVTITPKRIGNGTAVMIILSED
jgi:hypothetical protein